MASIRPPAYAGSFYPADAEELAAQVDGLLASWAVPEALPKAIVAPHAGYMYSGQVAAAAFRGLEAHKAGVQRVVILGPSHRVWVRGLAASSADSFATPLGLLPADREGSERLSRLKQVQVMDAAHAYEHSIEVELPFLQRTLGPVQILPLVVGDASLEDVAQVIELLWQDAGTLVVVSTDLSHFLPYDAAAAMDRATARAVEKLHAEAIRPEQACGHRPLGGLLLAARRRGLRARAVELRSSGDAAEDRGQVVGYGAFHLSLVTA